MANKMTLKDFYEGKFISFSVDVEEGNSIYKNDCIVDSVRNPRIVIELLEKGFCEFDDGTVYWISENE